MKTTLEQWAALHFTAPVPSVYVLRKLAREGRITPAPILVGREYRVEETATIVGDPATNGARLVQRLKGPA